MCALSACRNTSGVPEIVGSKLELQRGLGQFQNFKQGSMRFWSFNAVQFQTLNLQVIHWSFWIVSCAPVHPVHWPYWPYPNWCAFKAIAGRVIVLPRRTCNWSSEEEHGNTPCHAQGHCPLLKCWSASTTEPQNHTSFIQILPCRKSFKPQWVSMSVVLVFCYFI